jgi:hypothetical protein
VLTRSTPIQEAEAENFKGIAVVTRCGWDSRAPRNCKFGRCPSGASFPFLAEVM